MILVTIAALGCGDPRGDFTTDDSHSSFIFSVPHFKKQAIF
jgi:hypothetical protein